MSEKKPVVQLKNVSKNVNVSTRISTNVSTEKVMVSATVTMIYYK
jgi:hypothetical protein